jgi:transcriptional regulator with XRE-family HTH domain
LSPEQGSAIGARLRAARERRGWNREALAFHSGISWSAIAQIESGRRTNLRPSTLAALARPLEVTIDYLVSGWAPTPPILDHRALLYDSDEQFVDTVAPFLTDAMAASEPVLVVTSAANIELVRDRLGGETGELEFADRSTWYGSPAGALGSYRQFLSAKLEAGALWVRILGEPVWDGRSDLDVRLWTRYESLLNLALGSAPATFLCPYDTRAVDPEIVRHARTTHPRTYERDGIVASPEYLDPTRSVLEP